jgi:hypothetical protein
VDWYYDEDYTKDTMLGAAAPRVEARQRFGIDAARPNVAGLVKARAGFIVPPDLGRDHILCAARVLGPERIEVNTAASSSPALSTSPWRS